MIEISTLQKERFAIFSKLLQEWNKTHRLSSDVSCETIKKNIEDSIYPINFISTPKSVADIGSGAGYPALLLAVMLQDSTFRLFEPLGKKASFLLNATIEMGLNNVKVEQRRVEEFSGERFDLITSRAVARPDVIVDLAKNISDKKSRFLLYTGVDGSKRIDRGRLILKKEVGRRVYLYFEASIC